MSGWFLKQCLVSSVIFLVIVDFCVLYWLSKTKTIFDHLPGSSDWKKKKDEKDAIHPWTVLLHSSSRRRRKSSQRLGQISFRSVVCPSSLECRLIGILSSLWLSFALVSAVWYVFVPTTLYVHISWHNNEHENWENKTNFYHQRLLRATVCVCLVLGECRWPFLLAVCLDICHCVCACGWCCWCPAGSCMSVVWLCVCLILWITVFRLY